MAESEYETSGSNGSPRTATRELLQQDRDRQIKALSVELGAWVAERTAIYLDTCFWIHLREANRGNLGVRGHELIGRLRGAVATGQAVCPITDATIFELLKQTDPQSRAETARLIDDLSLGVALVDTQTRMGTEIAHLVKTAVPAKPGQEFHPLDHLVWTRGLGVMGIRVPFREGLPEDVALRVQRRAIGMMWNDSTVEQIVENDVNWEDDDFRASTAQLNRDIAAARPEVTSFKTVYAAEAEGVADVCIDMTMDIVADSARQAAEPMPPPDSPEYEDLRRRWRNLLAAALKRGRKPRRRLRTLHAHAALHASLRFNAGQLFAVNDLYDFEHASAALAYCGAFFTERPLWQMVTAGNIALDQVFGCEVIHDLAEACRYLDRLARQVGDRPTS